MKFLLKIFFLLAISLSTSCKTKSYTSKKVYIADGKDSLDAVFITPKKDYNKEKSVLLIFIHGDGAITYDSFGYYNYYWEKLAQNGISSLSWSKKGVDGSSGNWLCQNMEDRAKEVVSAINYIKTSSKSYDRIGVIGFSQAGWVLPKLPNLGAKIDFMIFISPAINWKEQSNYMLSTRLSKSNTPKKIIKAKIKDNTQKFKIFDLTYDQYLKRSKQYTAKSDILTNDRFNFIKKNINSDATNDLKTIKLPVFTAFAKNDELVNAKKSYKVFDSINKKHALNHILNIYNNSNHAMLKNNVFANSKDINLLVKLNYHGEESFTPNFLNDLVNFCITFTK